MLSLADVLHRFGDAYTERYSWTPDQAKAAGSIRACRTDQLASYVLECEHCGCLVTRHASCRNRHCPHCQRAATEQWLAKQQACLLPVKYFHLVFTLPHQINGWIRLHPKLIYGLLFRVVWETLQQFGRDPKRLKGELGVTAVLHTWGQTLDQHVHLHCLVPAGAWSESEQQWHSARSNYLFPVKALSRCYRGKMVSALREAFKAGDLFRVTNPNEVDICLDHLMSQDWVVYTKACHQHTSVLAYLSRYTHRIAISECRLLSIQGQDLYFKWKDYRDGKQKVMRLEGVEFLRRFLQHVLPSGFMRIRHYGFLANACRHRKLNAIRNRLSGAQPIIKTEPVKVTPLFRCPGCKQQELRIVHWLKPAIRQRE